MIKKLLNSKTIVTIICLIVCGFVIVFAYNSRVSKKINKVTIPVASRKIEAREEIIYSEKKDNAKSNVKAVKVAQSLLSSNVIQTTSYFSASANKNNKEEYRAKYVNYNTFIPEGGMFYSSSVVEWSDMPDSAWNDIGDSETILYIDINDGMAYGNAIYPEDTIDLYVKMMYEDKVVYSKFVEKIQVLAVKDENGNHISKRTPSTGKPSQIIFKLDDSVKADDNLFLLLKSATYFTNIFEIVPVPRNKEYKVEDGEKDGGIISSEFIVDQIRRKSKMLLPDVIAQDVPVLE